MKKPDQSTLKDMCSNVGISAGGDREGRFDRVGPDPAGCDRQPRSPRGAPQLVAPAVAFVLRQHNGANHLVADELVRHG
jgi:hypothetical protein